MNYRFAFHGWRRDIGNLALFKYRDYQGFIVTGRNSGTHWLKYMLSVAIARRYGLPVPESTSASESNDFIGHPKHERIYPQAPRIASTHSIPHPLTASRLAHRLVRFPPYVVLVRDIRAAMVSHFEKWRQDYGVSFSEFIAGDPDGGRHWADVWWHIRFCNRWGPILERWPETTLLIHYEDLRRNAVGELAKINDLFGLDLDAEHLAAGVGESTKEKLAARISPAAEGAHSRFVRFDERDPLLWFSEADLTLFQSIVRDNLRYPMGYDYTDPSVRRAG